MIAQVIPGVRLPRAMGIFDYAIPASLASRMTPGLVVRVPFRQRSIDAIVWNVIPHATIEGQRLREIEHLESLPALNDQQRHQIDWLAHRYAVTPSLFVRNYLNDARLAARAEASNPPPTLPLAWPDSLRLAAGSSGLFICIYNREHERHSFLADVLQRRLSSAILIISPELPALTSLARQLPPSGVLIQAGQRTAERAEQLRRLLDATHILGTRSLLTMALPRLSLIVLDAEDSAQHKQRDQQPRFSSLSVALKLAEQFHCPVVALSPAPTLTAYDAVRQEPQRIIRLGSHASADIQLVERTFQSQSKGLVSHALFAALRTAVERNERTFILLNRRGLARLSVCADCGWIARCEACGTALMRQAAVGWRCPLCGREAPARDLCPICQSPKLESVLPGTASLERELLAQFPEHVTRLDRDTGPHTPTTNILVGTDFALPRLQAFAPRHIIVLGNDALFVQPIARAVEQGFQRLRRLAVLDSVVTLTVETRYPNHAVFQSLAASDVKGFLETEWQARQDHALPPVHPTMIFEARTATSDPTALRQWLANSTVPTEQLRGPVMIRRGKSLRARYQLSGTPEAVFPRGTLTRLPESWIIDPDPNE